MSARKLWAFRLVVEIPKECTAPGYVPPKLLEEAGRHRDFESQPFTWPRRRLYFDWSSACQRAYKLASWGATVRVEKVLLEDWDAVIVYRPDAMPELVETAAA